MQPIEPTQLRRLIEKLSKAKTKLEKKMLKYFSVSNVSQAMSKSKTMENSGDKLVELNKDVLDSLTNIWIEYCTMDTILRLRIRTQIAQGVGNG